MNGIRSMRNGVATALVGFALFACTDEEKGFKYDEDFVSSSADSGKINMYASDPNALYEFYAGNTLAFYYPSGAWEFEYYSPEGGVYYWRPEEELINIGVWQIEQLGNQYELCFYYAYNGENYGLADRRICNPAETTLEWAQYRVAGDPFKLSTREEVPLELRYNEDYPLPYVAQLVGVSPFSLRYLDTAYDNDDD